MNISKPLTPEQTLFFKCAYLIGHTMANAAHKKVDPAILQVAREILAGQHDGVVGTHGECFRAIVLEQSLKQMHRWRLHIIVGSGYGSEDKELFVEFEVEEKEIPTNRKHHHGPYSNSWLLFPRKLSCLDLDKKGHCNHCGGAPLDDPLFDEKMLGGPEMKTVPISVTRLDGLVN